VTLPLTPEVLAYDLRTADDPQVSPDGTLVLYALSRVDPDTRRRCSELWLCGVDGSDARPLRRSGQRGSDGRWSPDGSRIAFVTPDRPADPDGADGEGSAIFVQGIDDGAPPRQVARHAQDIGDLAWAPDGRHIAYTTAFDPENPDESAEPAGRVPQVKVTRRIDYKEDGRGWLGDVRSHVFVVDVDSGHSRRVTGELLDHNHPQWSPDGRWLAVQVPDRAQMSTRLVLVDPDSADARYVSPPDGMVQLWAWAPTGDRILYACDIGHSLYPDYYLFDLASGDTRRLTDDHPSVPAGGFGPPSFPVWLDERQVLLHSVLAGGSVLELLDTDTGSVRLLHRGHCRNSGMSLDGARRYVVQGHQSPSRFGEISVYDRESGVMSPITEHNAGVLAQRRPADCEQFQVKSGRFAIDCWLLRPANFSPDRRYPVVLDIHGGPSSDYGYGFMAHQQCLATNGFLVLYANPRGSTSYGREFAQEVIRDWGGGDCEDVLAALDAVLERPYADPARTGIFGISYGGYLTSWIIGHTDRFAAAVCGEPIFDLESDYGTSDVAFNGLERHGGGPPHLEREWYVEHSPSTYVHRTRTPTLIFAGEDDQRCPIGQSEQMFTALKKAGCVAEFARYPGGSHMFFAAGPPEHRADFLARTVAWFHEHLGLAADTGQRPPTAPGSAEPDSSKARPAS
jgi:dipeptidyl aminopeptidase/acylaminoacyl peptidase